jgi:hypothetical protein
MATQLRDPTPHYQRAEIWYNCRLSNEDRVAAPLAVA